MTASRLIIVLFLPLVLTACGNTKATKNSIEAGSVNWLRDHDAALKLSAKTNKPVFLLFQEIPG